jgi:broad specificity phosphatase PhoE
MPTLDEAIEAFKAEYGFSDRAWELFREAVERSDELEHRVTELERAVARLEKLVHAGRRRA